MAITRREEEKKRRREEEKMSNIVGDSVVLLWCQQKSDNVMARFSRPTEFGLAPSLKYTHYDSAVNMTDITDGFAFGFASLQHWHVVVGTPSASPPSSVYLGVILSSFEERMLDGCVRKNVSERDIDIQKGKGYIYIYITHIYLVRWGSVNISGWMLDGRVNIPTTGTPPPARWWWIFFP